MLAAQAIRLQFFQWERFHVEGYTGDSMSNPVTGGPFMGFSEMASIFGSGHESRGFTIGASAVVHDTAERHPADWPSGRMIGSKPDGQERISVQVGRNDHNLRKRPRDRNEQYPS